MLIKYVKVDADGNFVVDKWIEDTQTVTDGSLIDSRKHPVPAGLHAPKWNGTEWIEGKTNAELLSIAKARKKAELHLSFARAVSAGFPSSSDGTARTYALDSNAMLKWTGTLGLINSGMNQNITIKDLAGETVTLAPTQYKQFATDGFSYYNAQEANLWAKEADADAVTTTPADVEAVSW